MRNQALTPRVSVLRVASPAGVLRAHVIEPRLTTQLPPLVVLHGISRNALELVSLFVPEAQHTGRKVVVPHFSRKRWPEFQRPGKNARPDQALLSHLAIVDPAFAAPVDMFGHSGGAQLAHRFAMLYPQKMARLSLAAAGWYCLPDTSMPYPYGLSVNEVPGSLTWVRRHQQALPEYLRLRVRVFVGTEDTDRDASLRQNPALDRVQGVNRVKRAETFVRHFRTAASARGISADISLTRLPGVTHDVVQAVKVADLARLVTNETRDHVAAAC
jgi:pimeloyl-ACP methyl ester carboxylesterase